MTNPNTHPEQIVDKNGKVTTVHKSNGAAQTASSGRAGSVPAPIPTAAIIARRDALVASIIEQAHQDDVPIVALRSKLATLHGMHATLAQDQFTSDILSSFPDVRRADFYLDYTDHGGWTIDLDALWDGEGVEIDRGESGDDDIMITSSIYGYGVDVIFDSPERGEMSLDFVPSDEVRFSSSDRALFKDDEQLLTTENVIEIKKQLTSAIEKEAAKNLAADLRAVDPAIEGVGYSVYPNEGGWMGGYTISINDLIIGGKAISRLDHKDADNIEKALMQTSEYDLDHEEGNWGDRTLMF